MPSTVNLVIKSIEHIQEDLAKRDWLLFCFRVIPRNGIASVYGDVTQQLSELNLAVFFPPLCPFLGCQNPFPLCDCSSQRRNGRQYRCIVFSNVVPSTLAAFFPKEKLEMDKQLQEDVVSDANAFTTVSEDTILQTKVCFTYVLFS